MAFSQAPAGNIILIDVFGTGRNSAKWVADLGRVGLLARPWGKKRLRCVTHRHIGDADIAFAVERFAALSAVSSASIP